MWTIGESDAGVLMFKREVDKCMKYLYLENTNSSFPYKTDIQYYLYKRTLWESHRPVLEQGESYSTDEIY